MLVWYRDGKLHRQTADTCDGAVAETKARELQEGFTAAASGTPRPDKPTGKLLEDAVADFLQSKQQNNLTLKHVGKLQFELREFSKFALARGLVMVSDIRTEHVLAWRNLLEGGQNTKSKKVFSVIGFFEFCVEMGWIARNVARAQSIIFKNNGAQQPKALTDAQFEILLAAVPKVNGKTADDQRRKLRALVLLMRWTGLAIRDAVTIERARFQKNGNGFTNLFLHRAKTGHPVYCTVRDEIVAEIFAGANPEGRWLFVDSVPSGERELDNLIRSWGDLMSKLGRVADLKDENGQPFHFTSHGLRHTFVFWCLNKGMPTEDVAALIGDSLPIVAQHYSAWITGRQERLSERMIAALR
jgi:site-specific recombinase XerD